MFPSAQDNPENRDPNENGTVVDTDDEETESEDETETQQVEIG